MTPKPAVSLAAVPHRRQATLELAQRLEQEGFSGIFCPSFGDGLGLCEAIGLVTHDIIFGTSIANIYTRHPEDYAQTATLIHELSGGRFRFGIGVSHASTHQRLNLQVGRPLDDVRQFVSDVRASARRMGDLPPIVLATLRQKMVRLAGDIAQGAVWANGARSHMAASLHHLPAAIRQDSQFFLGNMVPTCIDDDKAAAAAVNRRTLNTYVHLPNYQNYWIEAGFAEEMLAIRQAIANREEDRIPHLMSDRWLQQVTLYGSAADVREGIEAWYETGITTLILVPSSTHGGQMVAFQELFEMFR